MAITTFNTRFSDIAFLNSLRLDVNSHYFYDIKEAKVWPNSSIELSEIMTPIQSKKLEKGELETDEKLIDLANIERRYNELINVRSVSEIGSDKSIIGQGDIVIPKIQPRLGNIFLNLENSRYICSSELIEYYCDNNAVHPKFLFYLLTHPQFSRCLYYTESGKTHRRVNPNELLKYKIPYVEKSEQLSFLSRIERIEESIQEQKHKIKNDDDIINDVIVDKFRLDRDALARIDNKCFFSVPFEQMSIGNTQIRSSVRYNKLQDIQEELLSHFDEYAALDAFLLHPKTKNGWSPENNDLEGPTKILGIDSLHFNGHLTTDNPKYTNETRDDINDFVVKDGDFYISRGNTVNLVALASVAQNIEEDFIFPDIMIKLFIDESRINKMYLAYVFNSIIGRLYFKYVSRGKQQTMVKVSSDTIKQFMIPVLTIPEQEAIVADIQKETNAQTVIKNEINHLRARIDELLSDVINK